MNLSQHPAFSISYDELFRGLHERAAQGLISVKDLGPLKLFNYTPQCTFEKSWDVYTRSARGLVLNTYLQKVEALGMPKFFNYSEVPVELPNEQPRIYPKVDGSCVIFYYSRYHDAWKCVTRGSFDSDQAQMAEYLFYGGDQAKRLGFACPPSCLDPSVCYVFEVIYPENRIVINYNGDRSLRLLAAYNRETGYELDIWSENFPFGLTHEALKLCYPVDPDSIESLVEKAKNLPASEEGWVAHYPKSGLRLKIKGDAYCLLHKTISRITPLAIWEHMFNGTDLIKLRTEIPEEFQRDFDAILRTLSSKMTDIFDEVYKEYIWRKDLLRKEYAIEMQKIFQDFRFGIAMSLYLGGTIHQVRQSILRQIRPTGNVLAGYTPSNAMNRFAVAESEG